MADPSQTPIAPLRVAVAQPKVADCGAEPGRNDGSISDGRLVANVAEHARLVTAAQADLVVFPELSLTGYRFGAPAIEPDSPYLDPLISACAATHTTALIGVATPTPEAAAHGCSTRFIAMLVVDAPGARVAYRKMNLGADEAGYFASGTDPAFTAVAGRRVGLAICKDTGLSDHARATAALGIDLYAAGVVEDDPAEVDRRARRIATTHRVWVAIAAFAGATGEGFDRTTGRSAIYRPDGSIAARAGQRPGDLVVASVPI